MLLQSVQPVTNLPLPSFYVILAIILTAFYYGLPKIRAMIPYRRDEKDLFESEARIIFALLIGVVATFELLGLHPIIAGFFAGLVLSDSIKSKLLIDKLHTMSYGIFIPTFFVVIGMETNIAVLGEGGGTLWLILAVVLTSTLAKLGSGWLGGRMVGLKSHDAAIFGLATIPQLSTTLAVVFTGVETRLLPATLMTAMVALSLVTTLIAPLGLRYIAQQH
jgi:Kef-type K+ transport system membrane component KefB